MMSQVVIKLKVVTGIPPKVAGGSRISICHEFSDLRVLIEHVTNANSATA